MTFPDPTLSLSTRPETAVPPPTMTKHDIP